jgi:ADP-heptose:LPS heptosyltransferase
MNSKKILIVPKGFFGDLILITPLIAALKQSEPGSFISVLCAPAAAQFYRDNPHVSDVVVYDKRGEHRGLSGLRRIATRVRELGFDVAYCTQRAARIGPKASGVFRFSRVAPLYFDNRQTSWRSRCVAESRAHRAGSRSSHP